MQRVKAVFWAAMIAMGAPAHAQPNIGGPIAGGWSAVDLHHPPINPDIGEAARFATGQLGRRARLARIESASQQVVAGMNYRLTLRLTNGRRWEVTVWRALDGTMTMTGKQHL